MTHQSIHGHEIIGLILEASPPFTRATLAQEVAQRFGPDARFHTCSLQNQTLDGLLAFLVSRGKVVESNGRLEVQLSEVCSHGDDHDHHDE